ncbi:MAG: acyltransferase family protein [Candidatus Nanosalina sp.]
MADRIESLDTLKGFALLFVFYIHAALSYFGAESILEETLGFIFITFSRLAVPLFFLTSGYLLKMKLELQESQKRERSYTRKFAEKIGKYYLIGSGIFLFLQLAALQINSYLELEIVVKFITLNLGWPEVLYSALYTGKFGAEHLWFLLALFYSVITVYLFYRYDRFEELLGGALLLHAVGILSRAYGVLDQIPVPRDDFLFFGLAFTALGFYVRKKKLEDFRSGRFFLGAAVFVNLLHLAERAMLSVLGGYEPYFWANYSFLTAPAALTVFLYFLNWPDLGENWRINRYGRNTLWIYILHPAVLGVVMGIGALLSQRLGFTLMESLVWTVFATLTAYYLGSELVLTSWREKIWGEN